MKGKVMKKYNKNEGMEDICIDIWGEIKWNE